VKRRVTYPDIFWTLAFVVAAAIIVEMVKA
jgi:hypothetical protein